MRKNELKIQLDSSNPYYYSEQQQGIDNRTKRLLCQELKPFVKKGAILELGYVDGLFTDMMLEMADILHIVEGSNIHCRNANTKYNSNSKIVIHETLFQDFIPTICYDTIFAGDMIQYIEKPIDFLILLRKCLKTNGKLIVTTPNSRSMHRRIGYYLQKSIVPDELQLYEHATGNVSTYDRYKLHKILTDAGLSICTLRGFFLKTLSSKQISNYSDELLKAYVDLGRELEDYCWFLYAICEKS